MEAPETVPHMRPRLVLDDVMTPEEAKDFLKLESVKTLSILKRDFGLVSVRIGKRTQYHRQNLEECAKRMHGMGSNRQRRQQIPQDAKPKPLTTVEHPAAA